MANNVEQTGSSTPLPYTLAENNQPGSTHSEQFRVNARSQVRPRQYKRKCTRASRLNSEQVVDDNVSVNEASLKEASREHEGQHTCIQQDANISVERGMLNVLNRDSQCDDDGDTSTINEGWQDGNDGAKETADIESNSIDLQDDATNELQDDAIILDWSIEENFESDFIEFIKRQENTSIEDLLHDLEKKNLGDEREDDDFAEEINEDDTCQFSDELAEDTPVQAGHSLSLKMSVLLIWIYAIKHSLTSPQLMDLLTLINLHLISANPVFKSLYRFKNFFSVTKLSSKKHYFCSSCNAAVTLTSKICSNELCRKTINEKHYFLELNIKDQLQNFFKRKDFLDGLNHRFQRSKKKMDNIEDVYDSAQYQKLCENNGPLNHENNITFTLNTDGVPIFKSSKTSMWPIFLMVNELPYKMRRTREFMLLAGLWCGTTKPTMNIFLDPLLSTLNELESGITVTKNNTEVQVKAFLYSMSCDIPARSAVLNMNQHNGESCCVKCLQPGTNHRTVGGGNIRTFPYQVEHPDGPERTHASNIQSAHEVINSTRSQINGIKGPSVVMFCPQFDSAKGVAIDYMHLVCLGVVRLLLKLWFDVSHGLKVFSLYRFVDIVDSRLESIKPPHYISRQPRTIKEHSKFWKASELRSWMFYYSIPCISDLMQSKYLYHYCAFVEAVYLLCQMSISENDILKSEQLLRYFVFMLPALYDERYLTINVHSLLHLPKTVQELGPLWALSCFSFEGANGELLKLFHGTQFIDMQIANAVHVFQLLPSLSETITVNSVAYKFVKSLTKQNDSGQHQFSFHGKGYEKILSKNTRLLVLTFLNSAIDEMEFFSRASIRGVMYHSQDYKRVSRRNSYSVRYIQNNELNYGFILWFAEHRPNQSTTVVKCVCIEKLVPTSDSIFDRNIENTPPDHHIRSNFMNIILPNLCFLQQTGENCIISLHDIMDLCICIAVDDIIVICEEPNNSEKNL